MIAILCIAHLSACELLMYPFIPLIIMGKGRVGGDGPAKCPNPEKALSPLYAAAMRGDLDQFKKLLSVEQAKPHHQENMILEYALRDAALCGHKNIVELALTYKPDLYRRGSAGGLPVIFYLAQTAQPQLLELILQHGYDANFHYDNRWYPIFLPICHSNARKENITILLRNGASKDVINEYRQTPLERAIQCQDKEAIRRLQQDPNQPEEEPKPFSGRLN